MAPYRRYRQRLLHLVRDALCLEGTPETPRSWTLDYLTWETFCLEANADGIAVAGLLRDLDLQILESTLNGVVRLSTRAGAPSPERGASL